MLSQAIITDVSDDGKVTNSLHYDHPPIDWIGFDRQDTFFEVDDFILGCMQADDTSNEHHSIWKRQGRCKKSSSGKNVDNVHISRPWVVQLLIEHVTLHLVLFFVKVIDAFKETVIELSDPPFLPALQIVIDLKHHKWK